MVFKVGNKVKVKKTNDNENYDDFRNRILIVTHVARNREEHPGYDEGVSPQRLYDLKDAETGEDIGSSLYDYELTLVKKGDVVMVSLAEMRKKNKQAGRHFFDKGNKPVVAKIGNYVVTRGSSEGFVIYEYNPLKGSFDFVDNPEGEYSWQPYSTKAQAVSRAKKLQKR